MTKWERMIGSFELEGVEGLRYEEAQTMIAVVKAVANAEPCAIDNDTGYWTCVLCGAHDEHAYPSDVKHAGDCAYVLAQRLVNG